VTAPSRGLSDCRASLARIEGISRRSGTLGPLGLAEGWRPRLGSWHLARLWLGWSRAVTAAALVAVGACAGGQLAAEAANENTVPAWHAEAVAPPVGAATNPSMSLGALVCPSATYCVATGSYKSGTRTLSLIAVGTGLGHGGAGSWSSFAAPVPAGAAAVPKESLADISCLTRSFCVAVGSYRDLAGNEQAVVVSSAGSTWAASEVVLPGNAADTSQEAHLTGVSCQSGTCTAVGQYSTRRGSVGMLAVGRGPKWHARPLLHTIAGLDPTTIACARGNSCVAIAAATYPVESMLVGDRGTWTDIALSPPADGRDVSAVSLACPAPGACISVGTYFDAKGAEGLIESQSGSSFVPTEAPLPADASTTLPNGDLTGIACATTTSCTAVGSYSDAAGATEGLILTGSGTTWAAFTAPLPANGDHSIASNLFDVACESSGNCVTWGNYVNTASNGAVMFVSGAGSAWVAREAYAPIGHLPLDVNSVSLVGGTAVTLGGYVENKNTEGFADVA
jgi:hypothetical protein